MKSQLLSVLSVVGIMGTATAALAANTDVLTLLDDGIGGSSAQAATGTSLDVPPGLIPEATPAGSVSAEPAPAEPSSTNDDSMAPVTSTGGTSVSEPGG